MDKNFLLTKEIIFNAKPDAVPYNYRISYKIGQLCLILYMCCGHSGCSLFKLHMISMSLCTQHDMDELIKFSKDKLPIYTVVRFDPAVNRAIKYAMADELIYQQRNGLFRLSEKGRLLAKKIESSIDVMTKEKSFLSNLSNKLTEVKIKNLMSSWRYLDVNNK